MKILSKSTILYINQNRIDDLNKLMGKGISEALSWIDEFKRIIFICYSSTNDYLFKKVNDNFFLIAIPFEIDISGLKTIFKIGKNYLKLFYFIFKLTHRIKINIIRVENVILSGIPILCISKLKKIPYVIWHGGNEIKSFTLKYKKFSLSKILTYFISFLQRIILTNANFVFNLSHELLEIGKRRGVKNQKVSPNFLDILKFQDLHNNNKLNKNDKVVSLYVGRFEEEKGIKVLFNAIDLLKSEKDKFELLLVGYGTLESWMRNFIKKKKIENVKILGKFSHFEMPRIYNLADVFILPSHTETLTAALLEAMSCGCAPISTNVGDIPRLIKQNYNGILIPPNNPKAIAESMKNLIYNKEQIFQISRNARKTVIEYVRNYKKIHRFIYETILKLEIKNLDN